MDREAGVGRPVDAIAVSSPFMDGLLPPIVGLGDIDPEFLVRLQQIEADEVENRAKSGHVTESRPIAWQPHPGFQERAVSWIADELFIGGAAGPGKTDCLVYGSLAEIGHPATRILFLRQTFPELREVMDRTLMVFPRLGAKWSASEKRWVFPSGAKFEFGFCATFQDATRYQGQEYTRINFDELGQIKDERIVDILVSRLRVTDPTYPIRPMFAASANPGGAGHAMCHRRYVAPTLSGKMIYVQPESGLTRAFIPGRVSDNPSIRAEYIQRLKGLSDTMRRQLLDGDWEAGAGAALDELDPHVHLMRGFAIPPHWPRYAGFDWGFRHPWWFVAAVIDPDGDIYVYDCAWGRMQLPHDIAQTIQERFGGTQFKHIAAGHDVTHVRRAMDENTPTIQETFLTHDLNLEKANIARVLGLNNCRELLAWRTVDQGKASTPRLRFFDTPRNRKLFEALRVVVADPDNPEDALKVDANPETGEGGDDAFDAFRYLCATRIAHAAVDVGGDSLHSTFTPEVLRAEYERNYRGRNGTKALPGWANVGDVWSA